MHLSSVFSPIFAITGVQPSGIACPRYPLSLPGTYLLA